MVVKRKPRSNDRARLVQRKSRRSGIVRITIEGFRGFRNLELRDIAPITLVTGRNGAGKTNLLEAVFSIYSPTVPTWLVGAQTRRGLGSVSPLSGPNFRGLFFGFQNLGIAKLTGITESGISLRTEIRRFEGDVSLIGNSEHSAGPYPRLLYQAFRNKRLMNKAVLSWEPPDGNESPRVVVKGAKTAEPFAALLVPGSHAADSDLARPFGDVKKAGGFGPCLDTLRFFDPSVSDVEYLQSSEGEYFSVRRGDAYVPLGLLGAGISHAFRYVVFALLCRGGFLAIDEIENGLHYSLQMDVLRNLIEIARRSQTQVMMTTHSAETVRAFLENARNTKTEDVGLIHLKRMEKGDVRAFSFRGADAIRTGLDQSYEFR